MIDNHFLKCYTVYVSKILAKGDVPTVRTVCKVEVVEETVQLYETKARTYGVRLEFTDGSILERHDIDTSKRAVEEFATHFLHEPIDEEQLRYVTEDFLAAKYSQR